MTITIRCVFKEGNKLYSQVFLDDTFIYYKNDRIRKN